MTHSTIQSHSRSLIRRFNRMDRSSISELPPLSPAKRYAKPKSRSRSPPRRATIEYGTSSWHVQVASSPTSPNSSARHNASTVVHASSRRGNVDWRPAQRALFLVSEQNVISATTGLPAIHEGAGYASMADHSLQLQIDPYDPWEPPANFRASCGLVDLIGRPTAALCGVAQR
jgi:hypothetical protein